MPLSTVSSVWFVVCFMSGSALASGGGATDAYADIDPSTGLDVHGFVDIFAVRNFNDPVSGTNQLRAFDFPANQPSLGYIRITLARRPRRVGLRVDAGAGDTADVFEKADPASVDHPHLARSLSFVQQAFGTVMLPLPREVELDVGKFGTPVGLEDNESLTNWNYARSLLYSWAEPALHTGLRVTCRLGPQLAASLFWVNGWNSVIVGGNGMRTFAGAATIQVSDQIEMVLVTMAGPERPPTALADPLAFRVIADASVVYVPLPAASFALTADYAHDRSNGGVDWWGAAWYAHLEAPRWLAATLRGEVLSDPQGFITGAPQLLTELTATGEVRGTAGRLRLVGRLEFRRDLSNALVFDGRVPASLVHQETLTAAFLAAL
jgi:hypothetical protein